MAALSLNQRLGVLAGISATSIIVLLMVPPIPQDPAYHQFADRTAVLGIPNFWNVVSNFPFLLIGLAGLVTCATYTPPGMLADLRPAYLTFFAGVSLVGPGSAYYHWHPDSTSLFWDRLPMTIAFMAFTALVVGENVSARLGRRLLWPLLAGGVASVGYWVLTETAGHGDLRPYVLVQFLPMLLIPLILLWFPSRLQPDRYLWMMLLAYGLAKLLEWLDQPVFALCAPVSGHSLKHLAAALGAYSFLLAVRRRRPSGGSRLQQLHRQP